MHRKTSNHVGQSHSFVQEADKLTAFTLAMNI